MLNRRHIRIKVMQTLYALHQSNSDQVQVGEKFLNHSMDSIQELYLVMLTLLIEIRKKEEEYIEISQKKHLATSEERNPNKKFIENQVLELLSNSTSISNKVEERSMVYWQRKDHYVQLMLDEVKASQLYKDYMKSKTRSFKEDQDFIVDIYTEILAPNEKIYDFLEDTKLTWVDDLPVVNTLIQKQLRQLKDAEQAFFVPKVFKDSEDKEFAVDLYRRTVLNGAEFAKEYDGKTPNWDTERIAAIDIIILKMAICEMLRFSSIPVKVTINEYLELAKEYSTPKSSIFINGILDNISKELETQGRLNKIGKGLL
ncbi:MULTISPECIES: transcription antitermination factor NusB [unclassified Myroides]|uniref:transcription antitermination factor NusB n=1 Tax=unclassified Myroides TaxID=2642485 RepID=UPI0015FE50F6|nr:MULTISPECIES: transcription antitermination factor NusB [unclassified Myroides]MBB1150820.1 transcription antitermination factor NusB [Myroides sp. NP-2]MDM1407772.1 transcription antitermination factor NusB [Myroides sp. DF42-4-2]